jgi:hypothetical protein
MADAFGGGGVVGVAAVAEARDAFGLAGDELAGDELAGDELARVEPPPWVEPQPPPARTTATARGRRSGCRTA